MATAKPNVGTWSCACTLSFDVIFLTFFSNSFCMIDSIKRETFVHYLESLIKGKWSDSEWFDHIIEHYLDERLEEIRRNVVRLRIAAGDPRKFPNNDVDLQKLKEWADELKQ